MTADLNALPARQRILLTAHDLFYQEGSAPPASIASSRNLA